MAEVHGLRHASRITGIGRLSWALWWLLGKLGSRQILIFPGVSYQSAWTRLSALSALRLATLCPKLHLLPPHPQILRQFSQLLWKITRRRRRTILPLIP